MPPSRSRRLENTPRTSASTSSVDLYAMVPQPFSRPTHRAVQPQSWALTKAQHRQWNEKECRERHGRKEPWGEEVSRRKQHAVPTHLGILYAYIASSPPTPAPHVRQAVRQQWWTTPQPPPLPAQRSRRAPTWREASTDGGQVGRLRRLHVIGKPHQVWVHLRGQSQALQSA